MLSVSHDELLQMAQLGASSIVLWWLVRNKGKGVDVLYS